MSTTLMESGTDLAVEINTKDVEEILLQASNEIRGLRIAFGKKGNVLDSEIKEQAKNIILDHLGLGDCDGELENDLVIFLLTSEIKAPGNGKIVLERLRLDINASIEAVTTAS